MKTLLFTFTFFVTTAVYGQQISEGWATVAVNVTGHTFIYHSHSIIKDTWPPTTVSAKISSVKDGKSIGFQQWEFRCLQQEVKVDSGNFISVASDTNSIRKTLLKGFCGINQSDGHWFLLGANLKDLVVNGYMFIDVNSIVKVNKPASNGISFRYGVAKVDMTKMPHLNIIPPVITVVVDCDNPARIFMVDTTKSPDFEELNSAVLNTVPRAMNHLVCSGYYPTSVVNNPNLPAVNMDAAKNQCKELGFKNGTEAFGKCVLQLSK
jgi:hypothetical protein